MSHADAAAALFWHSRAPLDPDLQRYYHRGLLSEILHVDGATLENLLIVAFLIGLISQNVDLALHYILGRRPATSTHSAVSLTQIFSVVWDELLDDETFALHCVVELLLPAGPLLLVADRFVMESILVGRIFDAGCRGVVLPLDQVIEQFLSLWLARSSCGPLEAWLTRLAYHTNTRRKFGVHLRSVWNLHFGNLRSITSVDEVTAKQKATVWQHGFIGSS